MGYVRLDNYPIKGYRGLLHLNVDPQQPQGSNPKSEGGMKPVKTNNQWVMVDWVMVDGMLLRGTARGAVGVEGARVL